ncbi:YceD family protein [Rugamonas sp.]|uniref:YceD family protein n=1 Tax=Rugamonas sp. TaxID=1926287 RepID=UPI0025D8B0A1|nr:YceD family protein [Rugamonas sp.]
MNAFVIDAFEFCRINGSREGVTPVAEMTRLTKDCVDNSGTLAWALVGGASKLGFPQLTLSVSGTVRLICQRCLTSFAHHIDASTLLMLGKDDEQADEIEAMLDDETIDVIVGTRAMNIMDLVEDEALLALPHTPKHGVCPDSALLDAAKSEKKSPFDALKGLKPE